MTIYLVEGNRFRCNQHLDGKRVLKETELNPECCDVCDAEQMKRLMAAPTKQKRVAKRRFV